MDTTETAVIKVLGDIVVALDRGDLAALTSDMVTSPTDEELIGRRLSRDQVVGHKG